MEMTYNGGGPGKGPWRFVKPAVIVLLLIALAAAIWHFASQTAGVKRAEAPQVTTVIPLPPPPPPPPPQKPPPEKPVDVKTPVDKPTDVPKPADTPKPSDNQPKQMTMNAPAQAGTDNFGIGAGDGSGMAGSGGGGRFGNTSYARYIGSLVQQAVERDKNVQDAGGSRFEMNVNVWMEPSGRITRAEVAKSTGDAKLDAAVVAAVLAMGKVDEVPPPNAVYPALVKLHGRAPA
ncbi:TonB family protein [Paraburkholderia flava]|uniref:TonB family protein n=1 Tax=Paraburkholderia flava TaxID=2547393 RepID=UPI00105C3011|nr:TonB family protein [Paraburkholderia flava]